MKELTQCLLKFISYCALVNIVLFIFCEELDKQNTSHKLISYLVLVNIVHIYLRDVCFKGTSKISKKLISHKECKMGHEEEKTCFYYCCFPLRKQLHSLHFSLS